MNILNKVISKSNALKPKKLLEAVPKAFGLQFISNKTFFVQNVHNVNYKIANLEINNTHSLNKITKFNLATKLPPHRKLAMPNLSPTMTKGNIVDWSKKEGDAISPGTVIASVETDKAVVDFEVNEEGFLAKILCPAGTKDVSIGTLVAILVEEKSDIAAFANFTGQEAESATPASAPASPKAEEKQSAQVVSSSAQAGLHTEGRIIASPLAKKTAREENVDLNSLHGSGPNGRIIQEDVLKAKSAVTQKPEVVSAAKPVQAAQPTAQVTPPTASAQFEDIELSNVRKVIADRLLFSKTNIPHFYLGVECRVDKLLALRAELNKHSSVKISINDMIIKAASLACMKVPETNSSWQGNFIRKYKNVDMSVAVQTDFGLITPIVTNSNLKGLAEISKDVKDLADRAKQQKLKPQEFQGGTFTISNLGMMGITNFSAIINPPQSCILAVGKSEKKVVFDEHSTNKDAPYKVVNMMSATLSCDHRVVDGAVGAKWVSEFKLLIENPELMLL